MMDSKVVADIFRGGEPPGKSQKQGGENEK